MSEKKVKKVKKKSRTGSEASSFDQKTIQEFKEAFAIMDQDKDGVISKGDLKDLYATLGSIASESQIDAMLKEAPGPINFTVFLTLFGERLTGTDPEATIIGAFQMWDKSDSGFITEEALMKILKNKRGEPLSEDEVQSMYKGNPPISGGNLGWKDHKFECKGIKLNKGQVPDIEVRLLGRIVSRHKAILCGLDKKDPDFYKNRQSKRKIMEIWAHTERIKNDEYAMRKFEGIYERLCRFYDPKAMLNKQIEIGKGLYLDLCAYDHSCRPNTVYSCHSFIATLRSLDSKALLPFIDPNNSALLLELHLNVENCLRLCYPHNHPALAFHLRNIGIFAKKLGQRQKALNYLGEALGMFKFVMGEGHSLYKITEEIIEEVKKELPEERNEGKDIRKTGNEGKKVLEVEKASKRGEDNEEGGKKEENEAKIKTEANQEGEAKLETEAIIEETEAVKNKGKKRKKRQNKNKQNIITRDNCYDKKELNSEANTEKLNYEISKIEAKNKQALLKVEAPPIILIETEDKKEDKNDYNNNEKEQEECRYCLNNTVKDGGGVKKKLLQKKSVPRASTPMYCNNVWGGNKEENKEIEDGKEEKKEDSSIREEDKKEEVKEEKNEEVKEEDENEGEWQLKQRRRKSRKYKLLNC
uniref:EF-hand domain-containing protein n=1 Tax=Meloidogyne javanica TaxID=6303 RepID=A0A915LJ84_MELJA